MKRSVNSTLVLTLSLFTILLTFFIVLNAMSDFKESRVIPVLASLEASFSSKIMGQNIAPSLNGEKKRTPLFAGGTINDLEVAFRNSFDVSYAKANTSGTMLQLELDRRNFIDILQKADTVGFTSFREKLLRFMNNASQPYRMDIIFYEKDPLEASLNDQKMIAGLLIKTGLAHGHFKVSTKEGDPERIHLLFLPQTSSLVGKEGAE